MWVRIRAFVLALGTASLFAGGWGALAPVSAATPAARPALDPTVVFSFPGRPIYVEPGQSWLMPIHVNDSAGGRPAMLQRREGQRWVTIAQTHANRHLQLKFPPTKQPKAGTYEYRLVLPAHGYFEGKTTKVQIVHVEPVNDSNREFFVPTTISGTFAGAVYGSHDTRIISWTGQVTFTHRPTNGLILDSYYDPTALSVTWQVDYTDWRGCHYQGGGNLGISDVEYDPLSQSLPSPGNPDRYYFDILVRKGANVGGTVTCPGKAPEEHSFRDDLGSVLETYFDYDNVTNGFQYVPGYPLDGWIKMVGGTAPRVAGEAALDLTWDLTGSGRSPMLRPPPYVPGA
jgi:5-hydroxyisourate hydrolase-like protein (transthyretin family)